MTDDTAPVFGVLMTATCLHFSAEMAAACLNCNPTPRDAPERPDMTERTDTTQDKPTFTAPKWDIVRVTFDCPTTGRVQTLMRRNIETGEMLPHPAALGDSQPPRDGV